MKPATPRPAWAVAVAFVTAVCAAAPEGEAGTAPGAAARPPTPAAQEVLPAGLGTLRQDDITVPLRFGDLLIKTTPLDEGLIRLTAPDTYRRLSGLANTHREALQSQAFRQDIALYLVSVFSYEPNVTFEPTDLQLVSLGLRQRPLGIQAVTPGWERRRLNQQETQMAVYAFDSAIDLDVDLVVEYQLAESSVWSGILTVVEAERARVRARAKSAADTVGAPGR